jgi:hypothetical protein
VSGVLEQVIAGKPDGAFVIRSSESRADCYVLSYIFRGQVGRVADAAEGWPSKRESACSDTAVVVSGAAGAP